LSRNSKSSVSSLQACPKPASASADWRSIVLRRASLSIVSAAVLNACGGGSSATAPAPAPASAPAALAVSGTAATGNAMAGAKVELKCSGGGATVTAASNGTYTASITGAAAPCMLRATSSDGSIVYHSAVSTTGTSVVANITPLTELVVAAALGDPTQVDAAFNSIATNAAPPASLTSQLSTATATVISTLSSAGITLTGIDPTTTPLVAATPSTTSSDKQDNAIDTVMANLAANQSSIAELGSAMTIGASTTQPTPPSTLLLAAAPEVAQCPQAHSGTYWLINHNGYVSNITFDFKSGKATLADSGFLASGTSSETDTVTWASGGGCQATITTQTGVPLQFAFSSGGMLAGGNVPTTTSSGTYNSNILIGLPKQKVPLSKLAGSWNAIEYDSRQVTQNGAAATYYETLTLDAQGNLACVSQGGSTCNAKFTVASNPDGTLGYTDPTNGSTYTAYVYMAPSGQLNVVVLNGTGKGMRVAAPATAVTLPAQGLSQTYVQYQFSNIPTTGSTSNWKNFAIDTYTDQVTAVDTTNNAYTRTYSLKDGAAYDFVDVVDINTPSAGFRTRPAVTFTGTTGTISKATSYQLPLGTGMTVFADGLGGNYANSAQPFFGVSVTLSSK